MPPKSFVTPWIVLLQAIDKCELAIRVFRMLFQESPLNRSLRHRVLHIEVVRVTLDLLRFHDLYKRIPSGVSSLSSFPIDPSSSVLRMMQRISSAWYRAGEASS